MVTQIEQIKKRPSREWLERENARLKKLAEQDGLTGLLNRATAESRINQELHAAPQGAMLLLDIDNFKLINDKYGHLAGDEALHELSYVLEKMLAGRLVARVGGDEFLAFLPEITQESELMQRVAQVEARLSQIHVGNTDAFLSVTLGAALGQAGDDYLSLFARADERLLQEKHTRRDRQTVRTGGKRSNKFSMDTSLIANDLREQTLPMGAFCQSYEAFQSIFRFLERSLCRQNPDEAKNKSTVVLFTLADRTDAVPLPECREQQMLLLWEEIENGLRLNDIFVQYSSVQYLVLLYGTDEAAAELVSKRICSGFYDKISGNTEGLILHHSFPLKPAQKKRNRRNPL